MRLRFIERNGQKTLQTYNNFKQEYEDVPLFKEETTVGKTLKCISEFERIHRSIPDGIMLGYLDYELAFEEINPYGITTSLRPGNRGIKIADIPVCKHPDKQRGIFILKEAQ